MADKINVSIIVPVYNVEKFLERCLESLVNQTMKEIEIICINDGSKDKSDEILNKYSQKDYRIKIIKQENLGVSVARNNGVNIAKGEYIGFVDSDDWVDLDFFEKLYIAAKNNNVDIAAAGIIRLHKFSKKFHLKFNNEIVTENVNEKFNLCDVPELSYVWNKIYKKEVYIKNNFRFEEGIFFEDVIFTPVVLFYTKKLVTVPNTYYYYWRNSNSIVSKHTKKINDDSIYAHKKALKFIEEKGIDITAQKPEIYRFKVFGVTVYKRRRKRDKMIYSLFNIIKWQTTA